MNDKSTFACAAFLTTRIAELNPPKSIEEIARAAGFSKPGTLQAVLTGDVALPINRVFDLARAIDYDGAALFRLATADWNLQRTLLPMLQALEEFNVSESELQLLALVRQHLNGRDLVINDVVVAWVETLPEEEE